MDPLSARLARLGEAPTVQSTGGPAPVLAPLGSGLVRAFLDAASAPGDAWLGRFDPAADAEQYGALGRTGSLAGLAMLGAMPGAARGVALVKLGQGTEANPLASRSPYMYNPPSRSPRPFEADYPLERWPNGPPVDAAGRLARDIEGRPLIANHVAGRVVQGADQALSPEELVSLAEAGTGRGVAVVAPSTISGSVGRLEAVPGTNIPTRLALSNKLTPQQASMALPHEVGHLVDTLAGSIPQKGLSEELKGIYNTLNNGNRGAGGDAASWGKPTTPRSQGYSPKEAPAEYMAEAIRAYMTDPNYLKTVAPNTAAAIRKAVNENPRLSPFIQFNSGGSAAPALMFGERRD